MMVLVQDIESVDEEKRNWYLFHRLHMGERDYVSMCVVHVWVRACVCIRSMTMAARRLVAATTTQTNSQSSSSNIFSLCRFRQSHGGGDLRVLNYIVNATLWVLFFKFSILYRFVWPV